MSRISDPIFLNCVCPESWDPESWKDYINALARSTHSATTWFLNEEGGFRWGLGHCGLQSFYVILLSTLHDGVFSAWALVSECFYFSSLSHRLAITTMKSQAEVCVFHRLYISTNPCFRFQSSDKRSMRRASSRSFPSFKINLTVVGRSRQRLAKFYWTTERRLNGPCISECRGCASHKYMHTNEVLNGRLQFIQ